MATHVNISLDSSDIKNNRIMVNNKDITKSVDGITLFVEAGKTPNVGIHLNDLTSLSLNGKIDTEVGELLKLPKLPKGGSFSSNSRNIRIHRKKDILYGIISSLASVVTTIIIMKICF